MRTLKGNRNRPRIIHLHGSPQKTPGNDGCFYRMLLHQIKCTPSTLNWVAL